MPTKRYQRQSQDLFTLYHDGHIDYEAYQNGLQQIKSEEITKVGNTFYGSTYRDREWIENDIWIYEKTRKKQKEQEAYRKAEADRKKALSPVENYKEDIPDTIARYREEANRYRRIANRLQIIIIVGSVLVTSATSAAGFEFGGIFRWVAPVISIVVAASAGLAGFFKFRERSFNLQQTADNIEQEYNAVKLGIGFYKGKQPHDALEFFATRVESMKEEQKKRQQILEQPPDIKHGHTYL